MKEKGICVWTGRVEEVVGFFVSLCKSVFLTGADADE
jgi:hypothetical protein